MRITNENTYWTIFGASFLMFALPALAQQVLEDPAHRRLESVAAAKVGRPAGTSSITAKSFPTNCNHSTISCGQTVTGGLSSTDCQLEDGSFIDFWKFQGTAGQDVTVTLRSSTFDTYLFLIDPSPEVAVEDDDNGGGSDSQLSYTLSENGEWAIGANSLLRAQTGSYTITLSCVNSGAPGTPAPPSNLRATVASQTRITLTWKDNANDETGFAIDYKTGSTFKEIGSVRADSGEATIDGLAPGSQHVFRVRARNANGSSQPSNEAAVTTPGDTGGGVSLISEHFPDFRFQVRIFNQSSPEPLVGRKEASCLPETLCVSGAIPGRSEVFVRVVGPRPNGYLWPTIVRLTSSKVEVRIEQVSTGLVRTYVLDAASPDADELNGLQDRTGFQP